MTGKATPIRSLARPYPNRFRSVKEGNRMLLRHVVRGNRSNAKRHGARLGDQAAKAPRVAGSLTAAGSNWPTM